MLFLKTLGGLSVDVDGAPPKGAGQRRKTLALLALLAAAGRRGASRDKLIAYLWPESDAEHARGLLKQACYALRRDLRAPELFLGAVELRLNPDVCASDLADLETALERGDLAPAVAAYAGPFLDGFYLSSAGEFERWVDETRAALKQRVGDALQTLAAQAASSDDVPTAVKWWRRLTELDPLSAQAALGLMRMLEAAGERAEAVECGQRYGAFVRQELGVEPATEVDALVQRLRHQTGDGGRQGRTAGAATPPAAPVPPVPTTRHPLRSPVIASVVAAALLGALGYAVMTERGKGTPSSATPRVLVLPFQNLGAAQDAYFADGITDEITARLATVKGLSVVGGQAALHYKGTDRTPRQIAQETGVDYVLEGTVSWQRAGRGAGRVRVRPQLVNTRDETQVWAAVLDENMTDLFPLLSGIAERVVGELHVVLEASQQQGLAAVPTKDLEAYDYYLRGRAFAKGTWSAGTNVSAIQMFERAVARDPTFALAQARLSFSHTEAFWLNQLGPAHLVQAKAAAERPLRLDPSLPDAHTALGHYYYACCGNYERALEELTKSVASRPGDAQVVMLIGNVYKRRGDWDQAAQYYQRAASLDPRWHVPLINLAEVHLWLRRYDDAERTSRRALSIEPRETFAYTILASVPLLRDGDIAAARGIVREAAVSDGFKGMRLPFYLDLLDHDYRAALAHARGSEPAGWFWEEWLVTDHIRRAVALRLSGDSATARVQFDSARVELVRELPGATQRRRAHNSLSSALAIAYAGLGRRSEAIALAESVMTSDPVAFDALDGPAVLENLALAYLLAGEKATALDILERVLSIPSLPSPQLLRLDPLWDPLRGNPRFERLVKGGR